MNLLFLQPGDPARKNPAPFFHHDTGVLASLLRHEGFDCTLTCVGGYDPQRLAEAVETARPDGVLLYLSPYRVGAARRTVAELSGRHGLRVGGYGPFATCRPRRAASMPGLHALLVGECERATVELALAWRDGREPADVPGLWLMTKSRIVKGARPEAVADLDGLPDPDRGLFGDSASGATRGEIGFKAGRGCPMWCAHCVNDWYMDLHASSRTPFVRRRGVGRLLDEVAGAVRRCPAATSVVFHDHAFAMDADRLRRFADEYPRRSVLPFRCFVHLGRLNAEIAGLLASAGCRRVDTLIGSGSRLIREDILSIHLSDSRIVEGCRLLRDAGLHVTAEVLVGAPYESEITIEETARLLERTGVDAVRASVFYPTPGSRAAEMCADHGWLSGRGEGEYWRGRSVLNLPSLSPEEIGQARDRLAARFRRPRWRALGRLLGWPAPKPAPRARRRRIGSG